MKQKISLNWKEGLEFEADINGHKLIVDVPEDRGGTNKGPTPKPFMLVALAGCTAMDVVSILKKMRIDFEDVNINVSGDMTEEHPKYYQTMHIDYIVKGKDLPKDKVEKAVKLSYEQYCGVAHLIKMAIPLTYAITLDEV